MTNITSTLLFSLNVQNTLGEGVIWDEKNQHILWTDIESNVLFQYDVTTEVIHKHSLPERLASFGLTNKSNTLIAAFESGFAYLTLSENSEVKLEWLHKVEANNPNSRLNDGRVDRQGRFWAGSLIEQNSSQSASQSPSLNAALYRLDSVEHSTLLLNNLQISNGLCWCLQSQYMYHADSPSQQIKRFDFDSSTGEISNPTLFANTNEGHYPDGSTIDANGNLWNAQWGGSCVKCYSPQGEELHTITLPVTQPSCVAIGGPNLDWLIVTTAQQDLSQNALNQQPEAGNLFVFKLEGISGLLESRAADL